MKIIDLLQKTLVGKKLKHTNSHGRKVVLIVESVKATSQEVETEASTQANDWWPNSYTVYGYQVTFEDGSTIEFDPAFDFEIIEDEIKHPAQQL